VLELTIKRVDKLEINFKTLTGFIKNSFQELGINIDKGNKSMETKIDELFENIGENNHDLGKIKEGQRLRAKFIKWSFDALKQSLSIIISIVTLYFLFKYGGQKL